MYIAQVVSGVWCGKVSICDSRVYTVVSSRSGIVFNWRTGAINDQSQAAKDIFPYFKSQLYADDPGHGMPVLILPNGLSKSGEQAHNRN